MRVYSVRIQTVIGSANTARAFVLVVNGKLVPIEYKTKAKAIAAAWYLAKITGIR